MQYFHYFDPFESLGYGLMMLAYNYFALCYRHVSWNNNNKKERRMQKKRTKIGGRNRVVLFQHPNREKIKIKLKALCVLFLPFFSFFLLYCSSCMSLDFIIENHQKNMCKFFEVWGRFHTHTQTHTHENKQFY